MPSSRNRRWTASSERSSWRPPASCVGAGPDPVADQRLGEVRRPGARVEHPREQQVVLHQRHVGVAACRLHRAAPVDDGRVVERVPEARSPGGSRPGPSAGYDARPRRRRDVPNSSSPLPTMSAPRLDDRHLLLEALGQADVVGVHPGDDLVVARRQAARPAPARGRRSRRITTWSTGTGLDDDELGDRLGELVGHRAVLHEHHLVGPAGCSCTLRRERRRAGSPGRRRRRPRAAAG